MSNESIGLASRDRTVRHIAEATRNSLKENYGIDNGEVVDGLLRIIGMHPDMFDTVKMDSIIISERLNDVSIDGNANKGEKTIAGIDQETASPANKAKGHDALYREMVEMYGHDEAQRLTGEMYTLSLGISDSTKLRIPYSYYAHTPVIARIGGEVQVITLKKMFEMFKHASASAYDADVIDCSSLEEKINFDSVKVSIEVWDNSNGWVDVSRIVRHKNDCGYTLYQTKDGDFAFVTNNHPVYMADGTEKCAEKLSIGDTVLKEDSLPSVKEDFVVDENLAYFTGFLLGDGNIDNGEIDYSKKFGFNGKENSFTKHLPENIMSWNREAKVKFICGLIDSDGTVFDTGRVDIRMMSYASIVSLYDVLRTIPGVVGLRKRLCGDSINNIIYGVQFRVVGNDSFKKYSEKMISVNTETYSEECDGRERGSVISKIFRFNGDDVKDTRFLKEELEYVYDITTSTGRFYANGMVQHNCFSVDASKLIYEGRPFGQLPSLPVQNLRGYISCLTETIHQMSSHLAGAIAVGSFFLDVAHICMYKHKYTLSQIKNNKKIRKDITNSFQHFVHSVNMLSRNSVESPFTNISINDKVKLRKILSEMKHMFPYCNIPIGVFNDFCGNIKRIVRKKSKQEYYDEYIIDYIYELQNIYLDFFDKGAPSLNGAPYRFPVTTLCLSKHKNKDGKWEATDTESLDNFAKREIYRYNIFASEGSKFASCCRLINDEELMDDYASQSNSFGAGGAISLGSHRVVTINFPRIAIESNSEEEFFNILSNRIKDAGKILKAHKSLIKKLSDAGLHMFIKNGWIRLDRMFSTFGIIGIYECSEIFREKFGNGRDIEGIILKFMNDSVRFVSRELGIAGNIEQIPGESFAVRFADADRLVFGEDVFNKYIKSPLYSNQFAPLWSDVDVWERLAIDGKYNGLITGGGIVHATIGAKVTYKQAVKIIKFAINCGCEHFALNSIYSECENKHITFGKSSQCPECGAKVTDWFTRIVGFFVRVSDFNKVRREWEFPRRKPNIIQ